MTALGPNEGFVGNGRTYGKSRVQRRGYARGIALIVIAVILGAFTAAIFVPGYSSARGSSVNRARATANHVVINEVYYDAPSECNEPQCEWIEIYNPTSQDIDISGWRLTDYPAFDGGTEGYWEFPSGTTIPAGGYILVVNDATYKGQFSNQFPGVTPDFDTNTSNTIPDVSTGGSLSLANGGDDVHLFDSSQTEVDAMWYGNGGNVGSTNAAPDVPAGHSLSRYYNAEDTDNPSADFYDESSPTPGAQNSQTIPEISLMAPVALAAVIFFVAHRRRKL